MLSRQELLGLGDHIKQMEDIKRKDAEIEAEKVRKAEQSYHERKDYFERKLALSYLNGLYDKRVVKEVIKNSSDPERLYLVILEKYLGHQFNKFNIDNGNYYLGATKCETFDDVKKVIDNAVGLPGFMSEDDCLTYALTTVSKVYGSESFASSMLAYLKARTIEPNYSRLSVGDSFYISEIFDIQAPVGVFQLGVL